MKPMNTLLYSASLVCAMSTALAYAPAARAEMVLSEVIVDLKPEEPAYRDIEVWNNGSERIFVVAQPFEIESPGHSDERRVQNPDPAITGILVTPQKMVLEADQRRIIRIAAVTPRRSVDRVYRITIKEVSGEIEAEQTALKVLLGYDVLAIYRPSPVAGQITGERMGRKLIIRNDSNTAQELTDGKQCDDTGQNCNSLLAKRLYSGAVFEQELAYDTPVEYMITFGNGISRKVF